MKVLDVSVPIHPGMVTYPGDPIVELERVSSLAEGALANVSRLSFGVHTGTHVDAPVHFIDGAPGSEQLSLEALVGPALVVEATGLDANGLSGVESAERILLKTSNSELWDRDQFAHDFISLTEDGARLLVGRGVRLVGIDYLSIGDEAAHHVLLEAGVVAIEGLDLRGVEPGPYQLVCAPLKLVGSDGAPARVFLLQDEGAPDG